MNEIKERIEVVGQILRWITPIAMTVIGFLSVHYLTQIDTKFSSIDAKFDLFISSYHEMDKRVDHLEYVVYDGDTTIKGKNHGHQSRNRLPE